MYEAGVSLCIDKVWRCRLGCVQTLVDHAKHELRENNTTAAVILRGLTSVVQPLDICWNKLFEDRLRQKLCSWMIEGKKTFIETRHASSALKNNL